MKHIVGLSGGADSQATLIWVRKHFGDADTIALNTRAGNNECGVTIKFLEDYSRNVFPVTTVTPLIYDLGGVGTKDGETKRRREYFQNSDELTFDRLAFIKGRFPSRKAQFCTEYLKLTPQKRWIEENIVAKGISFKRYIGVRRDESSVRANVADCDFDVFFGCDTSRPIAAWTKQEVFAYIAANGEEFNPLYKIGFGRVGCAPCVNASKSDIREWAARFPEMIDKVRGWEESVGRTFFAPMVPGLEINWIDEVVAWSRTAHGGRQGLLLYEEADASNNVCASKWGLCE